MRLMSHIDIYSLLINICDDKHVVLYLLHIYKCDVIPKLEHYFYKARLTACATSCVAGFSFKLNLNFLGSTAYTGVVWTN